jgi:hypothetical protein
VPRRRKLAKPPTEAEMLALREEMQRLFPCRSWQADPAGADGSVDFRCDCGAASGHYPSHADGEVALGEHLDAIDTDRRKYFTDWAHQHLPDGTTFFRYPEPEQRRSDHIADRVRRRPQPKPKWLDDFPRVGGPYRPRHLPGAQYGLANLLLYRMSLVGVVSTPIAVLADRLGLRVEQSFGESYDCEIAYFEHESDAFALVRWAPTENVEVSAYVEPGVDGRGLPQLERFLPVAGLTWADVVFPPHGAGQPMVVET